MSLRIKILSGFFILALMLLVAGIWSIYELDSVGSSVQKILDENYKSIEAAKGMTEALEREDSGILLLLLGKWEEGRSIMSKADSEFQDYYNIAYANITISGEKAYLDSINSKYLIYKNMWQRPIVDTDKEGNVSWYFQQAHNSFISLKKVIADLSNLNNKSMYETATQLQNRANRAIMPGIIAIISALIFTFLFNFLVHNFMVGPIIKITDRIKKFRENKIPYDVNIESRDEIYYLSESIRDLCDFVSSGEVKT